MNSNNFGTLEAIGIILTIIIAHLIIYLPERIITTAGSASIINVIYITAIVFLLAFIVIKLFKNFSTCDILDVSYYLGGNFLKKLLGLLFVVYCIFFTGLFIRDFAESLKIIYFHDFNISVILGFFLLASLIVNKFGLRKVVRCNLLILPLILLTIIIVVAFSIPKFTYQRIFPILGYGTKETFLFGLTSISAFSNFIILYYILPLLKDKQKFKKISFCAIGISAFLILCAVCTLLLISNYTTTQSLLSIYLATRRISFGSFLRRADSLFVLIWMLSMFAYISTTTALSYYIYNKTKTKSQNNSNSTSVWSLLVITALIWLVSIIPQNIAQVRFLENVVLKYSTLIFVFGINFVVLLLGNLKFKLAKKKTATSQAS